MNEGRPTGSALYGPITTCQLYTALCDPAVIDRLLAADSVKRPTEAERDADLEAARAKIADVEAQIASRDGAARRQALEAEPAELG